MTPKRIILLVCAAAFALAAVFLLQRARSPSAQANDAIAIAPPAAGQVLVAARDIALGSSVAPEDLAWVNWPKDAMNELFVQRATAPDALERFTGTVAREVIRRGEPVYDGVLVQRGDQGYFAAILMPGHRAVAIEVSPANASAGFIQPGDRVDVVLTATPQGAAAARAGTILNNVRVLAFGEQVQATPPSDETGPAPIPASVATLELMPRDAEVLMAAKRTGELSLILRGVDREPDGGPTRPRSVWAGDGEAMIERNVRVHAFGATQDQMVRRASE